MGELVKYRIAFVGLKNSVHNFYYKVNDSFFANFENSPIKKADVIIELEFDKRETMIDLVFHVKGEVEVECDRCLEPYMQPLDGKFNVYVKYEDNPEKHSDDEDVMYISRSATHIDVTQLIYEFINLSVPSKKIPYKAECCFGDIEIGNDDKEEKKEIDPRWESLSKLKKE